MSPAGTGVGSMPGTDPDEAMRIIVGELPDFVHLPELPGRGAPAGMVGRAAAVLDGLAVDLQPAGWRLTDATGRDQRRAATMLRQDLDVLEEHTQGYTGRLKVQVAGPWTLAAAVERPRGDKVLADFGARRDLAQSLAQGVTEHVLDIGRRVPQASVVVQVDEPALPLVLAGAVPTASGFHRHRTVDEPTAVEALRWLVDAVRAGGGAPVVHSCAAEIPVAALVSAGFEAISFDLGLVPPEAGDEWAKALDGGLGLWPGVVPSTDPERPQSDADLVRWIEGFVSGLGFEPAGLSDQLVVTPACGLAGATPQWARQALTLARRTAAGLGEVS